MKHNKKYYFGLNGGYFENSLTAGKNFLTFTCVIEQNQKNVSVDQEVFIARLGGAHVKSQHLGDSGEEDSQV